MSRMATPGCKPRLDVLVPRTWCGRIPTIPIEVPPGYAPPSSWRTKQAPEPCAACDLALTAEVHRLTQLARLLGWL